MSAIEQALAMVSPVRGAGREQKAGYIYFVQFAQEGPIKVGWATDVEARVADLQVACPWDLRLIHSRPGTMADERAIHKRLARDRIRGEWFKPSRSLTREMYTVDAAQAAKEKFP